MSRWEFSWSVVFEEPPVDMQTHWYFLWVLDLVFVCCLCGQAHLCAYIWMIFTFRSLMWCCWSLFPDGEWVLRFIHAVSFEFIPLVIPIVFQMEEEPFNPDYVDVDRVLEVSYCEDKDTGEVKWILFHLLIISQQDLCIFNFPLVCWNCFCFHFFHFVGAVSVFSAY